MIDPRCLDNVHDFPEEEMYEPDGSGCAAQPKVKCRLCGMSFGESMNLLIEEIRQMMAGTHIN